MDVASCLSAGISAIGAIGVACVYTHQRQDKKVGDLLNEGTLIQMEMAQASLKLAQVTAKAVTNQKVNGDVEEAMTWAKEVEIKYCAFMRRFISALGGSQS